MDATRCLREEHALILKVLDCFEIALGRARREGRVTRQVFDPFVEFFRGFADRCHHCKEEDRLFPCLERCGMPREGGPIAVMIHEHQLGRAHVKAIAECLPAADANDAAAVGKVIDEGGRFLDLLRHHIMKEDHVLFEMADELVTGPRMVELANSYAEAESAGGENGVAPYRDTFARCRALADDLCARYGVPLPSPGPAT